MSTNQCISNQRKTTTSTDSPSCYTYQRHPQVNDPAVQQQGREIRRRGLRFVVIVRRGSGLARGARARRHDGRLGRCPEGRIVDDRRSLVFARCGARMPWPDSSVIAMYPTGRAVCPWEVASTRLHRAVYRDESWPCTCPFRVVVRLVCPVGDCYVCTIQNVTGKWSEEWESTRPATEWVSRAARPSQ